MENTEEVTESIKSRFTQSQLKLPFGQGNILTEKGVISTESDINIDQTGVSRGLLKRKYSDTSEDNEEKRRKKENDEFPKNSARKSDNIIIAAGINNQIGIPRFLNTTNAETIHLNQETKCIALPDQEPCDILKAADSTDQVKKADGCFTDEEHSKTFDTSESETTQPTIPKRPEAAKFPKLYRLLRDGDDISRGLSAKNPSANESVAKHVATGSRRGSSSQFLSTCSSLGAATSFRGLKLKSRFFKRSMKDIAEIDVGSLPNDVKIIDLRTRTLRRQYETGDKSIDDDFHKFAQSHAEVLLVGKVPPSCLTLHEFTGTVPPDSDYDFDSDSDLDLNSDLDFYSDSGSNDDWCF